MVKPMDMTSRDGFDLMPRPKTRAELRTPAAVGRRIKGVRMAVAHMQGKKKITQAAFAKKAGLSQNVLAQYESGMRLPSIAQAAALCETYELTLDYIYLGVVSELMPFKLLDTIRDLEKTG